MKNVLFIVYYFPPMGGSGVQRPLKFVKYLREFGWNPIVLCPEPGAYHTFDESLNEELQNLNIDVFRVEADTPFHKISQRKKDVNIPEPLGQVLRWISNFIYLPDNKKKWIGPGFKKALEIIDSKKIDLIFSTAPPYSNLMLAKRIKDKTGIPVVMDLRDDWVGSHLLRYPTRWHRKKMEALEIETLSKADELLTVNEHIADSINSRVLKKPKVIGHGYDPQDFEDANAIAPSSPNKISFLYSGVFYPDSTPKVFLQAMAKLFQKKPHLRGRIELQFQGGLNATHWKTINKLNLTSLIVDYGYVDHKTATKNLLKANILWLNIGQKKNPEIISLGKTSEYFATKKPILGLVPEGSAKELLLNYGRAYLAKPYDVDEVSSQLGHLIKDFEDDNIPDYSAEFVELFNRKYLTQELTKIFNEISTQ
ncbi:glycosyltransferase [Gracilimonas sp.]|uniref:glycosyltransferase n=1 Tax=Gracilimonas sp. TaxID=1974203 RepID=UPI0028719215|nr:glycosyltransferase [Gracilimonas sp.]